MAKLNKDDFPENVRGLVDKTKPELLNIISRKDKVEIDLNNKINELNAILEIKQRSYQEICASISDMDKELQGVKLKLENAYYDLSCANNNIKYWKRAFVFMLIAFLAILIINLF